MGTFIEKLTDDIELEMIQVKGGSFTMGNNQSGYSDEKPEHLVNISDFYLGKYPITNVQFALFLNQYGSDAVKEGIYEGKKMIEPHKWGVLNEEKEWQAVEGHEDHPVIHVTWYGAHTFCQWLSEKSGHQYALPSEAQWEYAARGGMHTESHSLTYAGSNKLKEVGWYDENSHLKTKEVGLKLPNALGLYDMSGNVWEWCKDSDDSYRVIRGGSCNYSDDLCRVSDRYRYYANLRLNNFGFRVSRY